MFCKSILNFRFLIVTPCMTSFTSHMTSVQNICVPCRDKTGVILRLMENFQEMTDTVYLKRFRRFYWKSMCIILAKILPQCFFSGDGSHFLKSNIFQCLTLSLLVTCIMYMRQLFHCLQWYAGSVRVNTIENNFCSISLIKNNSITVIIILIMIIYLFLDFTESNSNRFCCHGGSTWLRSEK